MNKKIIIIICVVLIVLFGIPLLLALIFSSKGTLKLNLDPRGATVTIDKGTFKAGDSLSKNLEEGTHKITVSKAGYELFEENIKIERKKTVSKSVKLGKVSDILKGKGVAFVQALNNITPSTDPGTYQQSLQKYSTATLYHDLRRRYAIIPFASRPANHRQDHSSVTINTVQITKDQPTDGTLILNTTLGGEMGGKSFSYKITYTLTFTKSDNTWLISSMKAD